MILVNDILIEKNKFPDGTLLMKPNNIYHFSKFHPLHITWLYEDDSEIFALVCLKRHLDQFYNTFCLEMPYIPNARMDRTKSAEDVFTLKYFCEIINSLNFNQVFVRDAHSNVSLALLNNVVNNDVDYYIAKALELSNAEALFFPDEGAMKRYFEGAYKPYAFGMKKRDWETGKILSLDIINSENIVNKDVLIVDDICSRGGTFFYAAKALKEAGAKNISLYVTHLEKTVFDGEMFSSGLIDKIYTTESIYTNWKYCDKIHVL